MKCEICGVYPEVKTIWCGLIQHDCTQVGDGSYKCEYTQADWEARQAAIREAKRKAWKSAYAVGYADKSCGEKHGHTPNPYSPEVTDA